MTRDELLVAVNSAFGNCAWVRVGDWSIQIETNPLRGIFF